MGRAFNPDEIRAVATRMGNHTADFEDAHGGLTGMESADAFGELDGASRIHGAISDFTSGMSAEFQHGKMLADATSQHLHGHANNMDQNEENYSASFGNGDVDKL